MAPRIVSNRRTGFPISVYCPAEKEPIVIAVRKFLKTQHKTLSEYLMSRIIAYYETRVVPVSAERETNQRVKLEPEGHED